MQTITIHDLDDRGILAFGLRDILDLLAPASTSADWTVSTPAYEDDFFATGDGGEALEKLAVTSAKVTGPTLAGLANDTLQVIWGDFTGILPADQGEVWVIVRAVDSSFYEISTCDEAVIAKVTARFKDVRLAD